MGVPLALVGLCAFFFLANRYLRSGPIEPDQSAAVNEVASSSSLARAEVEKKR